MSDTYEHHNSLDIIITEMEECLKVTSERYWRECVEDWKDRLIQIQLDFSR